jgi:hypothetical protein
VNPICAIPLLFFVLNLIIFALIVNANMAAAASFEEESKNAMALRVKLNVKVNFSLTVITLTVGVVYNFIFEYQNFAASIRLFLTAVPRCHIDTCFWYPKTKVFFGILKASHFSI